MNRIAFVFKSTPHGSSAGREGLDALLSISSVTEEIGVFFINDGVFQILSGQNPKIILVRDYIATFKVMELYNIQKFWVCGTSLRERGLNKDSGFVLNITILTIKELRDKLSQYHVILTF